MTVLEGKGLRYERGGRVIFHDVDLRVGPGERLAVLGPSGSGKTSLLAVLGGLARQDGGEVLLDGVAAGPAPRKGLAIVLQGYGLVSLLTAAENIEVVLRAIGLSARDARVDAQDALELVGLARTATTWCRSSPAASSSGSPSPGRSRCAPPCWSPTSRRPSRTRPRAHSSSTGCWLWPTREPR